MKLIYSVLLVVLNLGTISNTASAVSQTNVNTTNVTLSNEQLTITSKDVNYHTVIQRIALSGQDGFEIVCGGYVIGKKNIFAELNFYRNVVVSSKTIDISNPVVVSKLYNLNFDECENMKQLVTSGTAEVPVEVVIYSPKNFTVRQIIASPK